MFSRENDGSTRVMRSTATNPSIHSRSALVRVNAFNQASVPRSSCWPFISLNPSRKRKHEELVDDMDIKESRLAKFITNVNEKTWETTTNPRPPTWPLNRIIPSITRYIDRINIELGGAPLSINSENKHQRLSAPNLAQFNVQILDPARDYVYVVPPTSEEEHHRRLPVHGRRSHGPIAKTAPKLNVIPVSRTVSWVDHISAELQRVTAESEFDSGSGRSVIICQVAYELCHCTQGNHQPST